MKKCKYICLSLTLTAAMLMAVPVSAAAEAEESTADSQLTEEESSTETFTCGDYAYTLNEDGTATLTRYTGSDAKVVIPDTVDDVDVTILGGGIFANKDTITSVSIPEHLTELKDSCFYGCTALTTFEVSEKNTAFQVKDDVLFSADGQYLYCYPQAKTGDSYAIPAGVTELWSSAFANTALTSVSFPDSLLYIDDWTFSYTQLTELDLPDSVVEIGGYAFAYCNRLTEVDFPADLEVIDAAAFSCNANLTKITLPDGLQTIQMAAFAGTGLTEVTIPATVSYIGFCAFGYEEDMQTTVDNFVIYGESGSQAEIYCTDTDEENDYENHFTFCSILSSEDDSEGDEASVTVEPKEEAGFFQTAGKWILIGLGALVLLIGGLLLLLSGRNRDKSQTENTDKKQKSRKKEAPQQAEPPVDDVPAPADDLSERTDAAEDTQPDETTAQTKAQEQ